MPGPMSDSYDPEFGTGHNCHRIREALARVYSRVSQILDSKPPIYILDLIDQDLPEPIQTTLSTKEWRLIRFALERAQESI